MATSSFRFTSEFALRCYDAGFALGMANGAKALARGMARGMAESLPEYLEGRGIELTPEECERISQCTDADQLGRWLVRSATAATSDDLFSEPADPG